MKNLNSISYFKMFALGCLLVLAVFAARAYADTTNPVLDVKIYNDEIKDVLIAIESNSGLNVTQLKTSIDGGKQTLFQIELTPETSGSFSFSATRKSDNVQRCVYSFNIDGGKVVGTPTAEGARVVNCQFVKDWDNDSSTAEEEGIKFRYAIADITD